MRTRARARRAPRRTGRSSSVDARALAEDDRALDRVLELAHVARPAVARRSSARARVGEAVDALVVLAREAAKEVLGEDEHVGAAHAQRRHLDVDDVEAVVEVLAEAPFAHLGREIAVGRGDEAHVDLDRLVAADALERPLLEDAQQLDLRRQRDLADLVEEERAAVGLLEAARCAAGRRR